MPQAADLAPDWSQPATPDLRCPLCEYNLRGLSHPRCPECGFAFQWEELIRGKREKHPYLFEHHPRRNIWSFCKTYWRDWRPRRFWKEINPAHRVRSRRLFLYWMLSTLPLSLALLAPFLWSLWDVYRAPPSPVSTWTYPHSVIWSTTLPSGLITPAVPSVAVPAPPTPRSVTWAYASAVSNVVVPAPPTPVAMSFANLVRLAWDIKEFQAAFVSEIFAVLAWPWLTLLCLLIFVQSMRRAKIRKRHVLRVIVYGCDFTLFMLVILVAGKDARWSSGWPMVVAAVCAAITLYRLYFAYARYLRFDHPFLTVLSTQIMVFLAAFIVYLQINQPW